MVFVRGWGNNICFVWFPLTLTLVLECPEMALQNRNVKKYKTILRPYRMHARDSNASACSIYCFCFWWQKNVWMHLTRTHLIPIYFFFTFARLQNFCMIATTGNLFLSAGNVPITPKSTREQDTLHTPSQGHRITCDNPHSHPLCTQNLTLILCYIIAVQIDMAKNGGVYLSK